MELINQTPFEFAVSPWEADPGKWRLTLVVKGTFDLAPDRTATPSLQQIPPTGDEPYADADEDLPQSIRYPSDFAFAKPRADILLVGACHAPNGTPVPQCKATLGVGSFRKSLLVFGERRWNYKLGLIPSPSAAQPFRALELRYENSYGGPDWPTNPIGKGREKIETPDGVWRPLPNIEPVDAPAHIHATAKRTVGFSPLHPSWPPRCAKTGTFGAGWLKERWPCLPVDFDWSHFNAAPEDQQLAGFPMGDEPLFFENLHPVHSRYRANLPGLRIRCFAHRANAEAPESRLLEPAMQLDTLWADMEAERLVLVWRGNIPVASPDFEDLSAILVAAEQTSQPPKTLAYWQQALQGALAAEELEDAAEPEPRDSADDAEADATADMEADDIEAQCETAKRQLHAALAAVGLDADKTMATAHEDARAELAERLKELGVEAPVESRNQTRESVLAAVAEGRSLADADLRGLDLSRASLSGAMLQGALMQGVNLQGAHLEQACLESALLAGACLQACHLGNARLRDADFTGAHLEQADLRGASAQNAVFENAKADGADLRNISAANGVFNGARFCDATLAGACLVASDFSDTLLDRANFGGADLTAAFFERARGANPDFSNANLTESSFAAADQIADAVFREVKASDSVWEAASLPRADFSGAQLERADFGGACLDAACLDAADARQSVFAKASLRTARIRSANLFQASLEAADLSNADLSGSNLYGAELLGAAMNGANMNLANLKMTKLA